MSEVLESEVDLTSELAFAEGALSELEREQSELPSLMRSAAERLDASELRRLRHRQVDIVADLFAAKARLLRLQIADEETKREHLLATLPELEGRKIAAVESARREADVMQSLIEDHRQASLAVSMMENNIEVNREFLRDLKRELQSLIDSQSHQEVTA